MAGKPKYYWDSSAFIVWLVGEEHAPGDLQGFDDVTNQVERDKADLFTSEITKLEVLQGRMTPEQKDRFNRLFQRRNVVVVDMHGRVTQLSIQIREWNPKISSPDAIHLATAILYEADEFHTTDGGGKRKRPGDLIPLSGNIAGHKLKICKPQVSQYNLLSGVTGFDVSKPSDRSAAAKPEKK
jgi:predicted nucleic acid-binding protein